MSEIYARSRVLLKYKSELDLQDNKTTTWR